MTRNLWGIDSKKTWRLANFRRHYSFPLTDFHLVVLQRPFSPRHDHSSNVQLLLQPNLIATALSTEGGQTSAGSCKTDSGGGGIAGRGCNFHKASPAKWLMHFIIMMMNFIFYNYYYNNNLYYHYYYCYLLLLWLTLISFLSHKTEEDGGAAGLPGGCDEKRPGRHRSVPGRWPSGPGRCT